MVQYRLVSGPHTHGGESSSRLMYLVMLALTPVTLYGLYLFGVPAALVWLVSCVTAISVEWVLLRWRGVSERSAFDGSALLTGWLLALSLPPSAPWWVVVLGSTFAIAIGKQAYGGLGQNLFNPAMLARVMLLICFPVELTDWRAVSPLRLAEHGLQASDAWLGVDAITAATPLAHDTSTQSMGSLFFGHHAGSFGETSSFLLLLGGVFLLWRRVINYVIPLAVLLGILVPAAIAYTLAPNSFLPPMVHFFSGASFMAAFFIATDMVTSPASAKGQWLFGIGIGLLMFLIRSFGNYPEGAAFAVLIMNGTTPIIDHYLRPTVFGARRKLASRGQA